MTDYRDITTKELEKFIRESTEISDFTDHLDSFPTMKTVPDYLRELLEKKQRSSQDIIQQINFSKSYYYKVLNGEKNPSRDVLLQLAILLSCSLEESNNLLRYGKFAPLYVKDPRDAITYYSIARGLTLIETNHLLDDQKHRLLD
jgi:transcriptional regulator with XRE-family HTH domain